MKYSNDSRVFMLENIRQKCIYKSYYDSNDLNKVDNKLVYWDYMTSFYTTCMNVFPTRFNNICSEEVMRRISINVTEINTCIVKSFNLCKISL